ncbi:class I SAM-dependent methyltransferase [Parashewanella curva]|uniref:Class I SAM-dependent methyltransferase n=1 Tax=Parashewanella curva TaxID=2338552 RepID=A0A3L8Q1V2_9GAMM|nr:class I SAM-dependent methyltransferase [Parashewanella curva]RLV60723.1 class I SAM-dependent methyltransferase [Parashewanella curva]
MNSFSCRLCHSPEIDFYFEDKRREYWQCPQCQLVQVPDVFLLSVEQEKAEYDKHDNSNDDAGYRGFLSRCLKPTLARVDANAQGLDFGCGEGKVLSTMAKEQGVNVANYDLFYANDESLLNQQYDFITCTEVIEHIADAKSTFELFQSLLNANGLLALMTKRVQDVDAFSRWHYKNDLTHICFYSIDTFEWIAKQYRWKLEVISDDVVILA